MHQIVLLLLHQDHLQQVIQCLDHLMGVINDEMEIEMEIDEFEIQ